MKYLITILVVTMFYLLISKQEEELKKNKIKPVKPVKKRTRKATSRAKKTIRRTKK
tara:strand:- start:3788 stop:3955 length:168 start_codon:yes stop_codon:yes gene_type:complete